MKKEDFIKKCSGCLTYERTKFYPDHHKCSILYPISAHAENYPYKLTHCPCHDCLIKSMCSYACHEFNELISDMDLFYDELHERLGYG